MVISKWKHKLRKSPRKWNKKDQKKDEREEMI